MLFFTSNEVTVEFVKWLWLYQALMLTCLKSRALWHAQGDMDNPKRDGCSLLHSSAFSGRPAPSPSRPRGFSRIGVSFETCPVSLQVLSSLNWNRMPRKKYFILWHWKIPQKMWAFSGEYCNWWIINIWILYFNIWAL